MSNPTEKSKLLTRRKFLFLSATIAFGVTASSLPIPSEAGWFSRKLYKLSFSRPAMGTFVNITVLDSSRDRATTVVEMAYQEMDRLIPLFSRFDPNSPLSFLNKDGSLQDAPSELLQVLQASLYYHRISSGAFDVTVLPVLQAMEEHFAATGLPPTLEEFDRIDRQVGSQHLKINHNAISFARPDMGVTLDSIAKGFIVDSIMTLLRRQGIGHAMVNAGGDIAVLGGKGNNTPWRIAIQDPRQPGHSIDILTLNTGSVATSGNYEIFFDKEKLYHHLITPGQILPQGKNISVSVHAASVMEADALATAIFVMGTGPGKNFLNRLRFIEGLIVSSDNKCFNSSKWQA
jgi:thiamine biosynthesis lipoprotein